jgi:hypothetical protein
MKMMEQERNGREYTWMSASTEMVFPSPKVGAGLHSKLRFSQPKCDLDTLICDSGLKASKQTCKCTPVTYRNILKQFQSTFHNIKLAFNLQAAKHDLA